MKSGLYPRERVEVRLRRLTIKNVFRVLWSRHLDSPLGCEPIASRFCDATFAMLYAAQSFHTAFLETVIRDRFAHSVHRTIGMWEIANRGWVEFDVRPGCELNLLDLRESGCVDLGVPTDAVHARNPAAGQALGRSIYRGHPDVDGFIYASRFASADNFAIFDRALHKLLIGQTGELIAHPRLPECLEKHDIRLLQE